MEPTLKNLMSFFGMTVQQFTREWKMLTPEDKEQIKSGLANNSLTY